MPVVVVVVMPVVVLPVVMMPVSVSVTPAGVTSSNELVSTAKDSLDVPRSDTVMPFTIKDNPTPRPADEETLANDPEKFAVLVMRRNGTDSGHG